MSEISKLSVVGDWRIFVQSREAGWNQRVLVKNTVSGTLTLDGVVGVTPLDVHGIDKSPWELRIQHDDGVHGWQDSWLRPNPKSIAGSKITQVIESEDITTSSSDRDFDDLVIRLEKVGMVEQPVRPFAVWPATVQMMPDGIFETALGRYFMAVRVRNTWTEKWPSNAMVGLTQRCKQWLAAAGIVVEDNWSPADQAAVSQEVANGQVKVGRLRPWESHLIYFKVDVSQANVGKHNVEIEVLEPGAMDPDHPNRKSKAQIFVSQTTYDASKKAFVSTCDRGSLTVAVREMVVDYNTFKRAIGKAREIFRDTGLEPSLETGLYGCRRRDLERLRQQLRDFLGGKEVDICEVWRKLQCCCGKGGFEREVPDDDWSGKGLTGMEFFSFPTILDYDIEYDPSFTGQYGPIPFDDPWWKILLIIIAIILTIAASVSAAADLANRSDDVVIGQVKASVLNALDTQPNPATISVNDPGSVDAATVRLNGNRNLTNSIFSYLDAHSNEDNTDAVDNLNGLINTNGQVISNSEINQLFQNLANNPGDPNLQAQLRVFKSGARTGTTKARLVAGVMPVSPRRKDDGGTIYFVNQLEILDRNGAEVSNSGDSGSLWLQEDANGVHRVIALNHAGCTNMDATACRIEDVLNALNIRF